MKSPLQFRYTKQIKIIFLWLIVGEVLKILRLLHLLKFALHCTNLQKLTFFLHLVYAQVILLTSSSTFSSVYSWEVYITFVKNIGQGAPADSLSPQHDNFDFYKEKCSPHYLPLDVCRKSDLRSAEQWGLALAAVEIERGGEQCDCSGLAPLLLWPWARSPLSWLNMRISVISSVLWLEPAAPFQVSSGVNPTFVRVKAVVFRANIWWN